MKRSVKLKFVDFWDNFVPENSLFYSILSKEYDIELSNEPDYLFYSVFGNSHLNYTCIKIFFTGENQAPDFNVTDYAIGFERLEFQDRYLRMPNYYLYRNDFLLMVDKANSSEESLKQKKQFCSFVYSNNNASPERSIFFDKLSSYKKVSSGGRFNNNVGGPVKDKLEFQKSHKFSIAFENCAHAGYVTEKLMQSFAAQTVPIYWGDPTVCQDFNPAAFVNVNDYNSFDQAIEVVKRIDNNNEEYLSMLRAPALLDNDSAGYDSMMEKLSQFLCHIVGQPLDKAARFSRDYWGKRYLTDLRNREKAYSRSILGILNRLYKNVFWKYRTKNKLFWKLDRLIKKFRLKK